MIDTSTKIEVIRDYYHTYNYDRDWQSFVKRSVTNTNVEREYRKQLAFGPNYDTKNNKHEDK